MQTLTANRTVSKVMEHPAIDELRRVLDSIDVTTYTLADAIREGAKVTRPSVGSFLGDEGEVCALSAAAIALRARRG